MDVYLSWSDESSKAVAEALREWLPQVIQALEPSLSPCDGLVCEAPVRIDKAEIRGLVGTLNAALGPGAMRESRLETAFEKWWPELEGTVIPSGEIPMEKLRRAALSATVEAGYASEVKIRDIQGTFWVELTGEDGKRRAQTHTRESVESKRSAELTKKIFNWVAIIQAYQRGERP